MNVDKLRKMKACEEGPMGVTFHYDPQTYIGRTIIPWWCCQRCGEPIGLLGRFLVWVGIVQHRHKWPGAW